MFAQLHETLTVPTLGLGQVVVFEQPLATLPRKEPEIWDAIRFGSLLENDS